MRLERERRGITLETLCAETKFKQRHLEALEQDKYDALPGGVFRRGIVRAYCASVGLEQEVWLQRFQATYAEHARTLGEAPGEGETTWVAFAENVKRNRTSVRSRERLNWVGVMGMIALVLLGAWLVWFYHFRGRH